MPSFKVSLAEMTLLGLALHSSFAHS